MSLLGREGITADSRDEGGRTALTHAAEHGRETVVTRLLEREDVTANSKDTPGKTPLFYATRGGHKSIVLQLLARTRRRHFQPQ